MLRLNDRPQVLPKVEGCFTFWTLLGKETLICVLYKLDSFRDGHVQSGQVGFPFVLNKALAKSMDFTLYKVDIVKDAMFRVGKWAFPCC